MRAYSLKGMHNKIESWAAERDRVCVGAVGCLSTIRSPLLKIKNEVALTTEMG